LRHEYDNEKKKWVEIKEKEKEEKN